MTIEFTVSGILPASPQAIYDAWLDNDGHTRMTGSPAHATPIVGNSFDAWEGHITGKNLELDPGKRIVQSWRAADYTESDGHSQIEITLEPVEGGTKITLTHSNVPDNQTGHQAGWLSHYFEPMKHYFGESK